MASLAFLLSWLLPFWAIAQEPAELNPATDAPFKVEAQKKTFSTTLRAKNSFMKADTARVDSVAKNEQSQIVKNAQADSLAMAFEREMKHLQDSLERDSAFRAEYGKVRDFNPDPNRAMWLSLLCPGLGQVYNRRYWKLPIVVGGFVGFGYATSWNNRMLEDYTKAYRDAMDSDPSTKSYMDLYPPNYSEDNIDMEWLKRTLKSKKDFYRRNKEICVIGLVGMYMLCVLDAYVDASLMQFDINDDIAMKVKPAVVEPQLATQGKLPSVGVQCAFTF